MKKNNRQNYLDYIPEKNPDIDSYINEDGKAVIMIEWKGFYHRIAQKFFHRPRVSDIALDDFGTFVWAAIDGSKDVHQISREMEKEFPKMEKTLSRLIKFLEIMRDNHMIHWRGEKQK